MSFLKIFQISTYGLFFIYVFAFSAILNAVFLRCKINVMESYIKRDKEKEKPKEVYKIVFLHPDLGIGGAERLIVDAAVSLQNQKKLPVSVVIVTNRHQPERAFPETVDGTLKVEVRASFLPSSIFGFCKSLCATVRMMCAAFLTCWAYPDTDAFIVDQVSTALPVLDYFAPHTPRLFYCHFPDQLCDGNRKADNTLVARAPGHHNYRKVMNAIEHYGMTKASRVLCNSHFSMDVSLRTFPLIKELVSADPLYPPVTPQVTIPDTLEEPSQRVLNTVTSFTTFVSINRYERKKNIKLAIDAFHETIHRTDLKWDKPPFLIIAGGYDSKLSENKEYEAELRTYALETLKIRDDQISFLRNISAVTKEIILTHMYALIYTPENEHFGIAPVEAMLRGKPVVAVNHGGPVESVKDLLKCPEEAAGILAPPTVKDFSDAMARLVADKTLYAQLGRQGKTRAETEFSTTHCGLKLIEIVEELCSKAEVTISKVLAEKNGTEKKEKKE